MLSVVDSTPANGSAGHYLNDSIVLDFNKEVEPSYASIDYIKLYRTNEDMSEFTELVGCSYSSTGYDVLIDPLVNLVAGAYYLVIVVGGEDGIKALDADTMEENHTVFFCAGTTVRPASDVPATISEIGLFVDGTTVPGRAPAEGLVGPSVDLFAPSGASAPIALVSTVPADMSVGVTGLESLTFIYNDEVGSDSVPVNALSGRYSGLPIDIDPFADQSIVATSVEIVDNRVTFYVTAPASTQNREFLFTLAPNVVRGVNRQAYDSKTHTVRLMGTLVPLYASPAQVINHLTAWDEAFTLSIRPYELYKLIHEKSLWVRDELGITMTEANMVRINRLVKCLVLLDLITTGRMLMPSVKSRQLLMTAVTYDNPDLKDMLKGLEDCILESMPADATVRNSVVIGIKSGDNMLRPTKRYGIYR